MHRDPAIRFDGPVATDVHPLRKASQDESIDELSMRIVEVLVAGVALFAALLLSFLR